MRTKLATLEVWQEDSSEQSSNLEFNRLTRHGELTLRIPGDPSVPLRTKNDLADAFAHELGHFMGHALGMESQNVNDVDSFAAFLGLSTQHVYQSEKEAWDFASKIRPVNQKMREDSLKTYADHLLP